MELCCLFWDLHLLYITLGYLAHWGLQQLTRSLAQSESQHEASVTSTSSVLPASSSRVTDTISKDHDVSQVGERQKMDAMGNLASSNEAASVGTYANSSSTASFMRQLRDAVDEKVRTPRSREEKDVRPSRDSSKVSRPKYCSNTVAQNCVLPPRHLADSMLNYFWLQGHALYPFLSKGAFLESYRSLWTAERVLSEQTMTYCVRFFSFQYFVIACSSMDYTLNVLFHRF